MTSLNDFKNNLELDNMYNESTTCLLDEHLNDYSTDDTSIDDDITDNTRHTNLGVCTICLESLNTDLPITQFHCMHSFHLCCINQFIDHCYTQNNNIKDIHCPLCRTVIAEITQKSSHTTVPATQSMSSNESSDRIMHSSINYEITTNGSRPLTCKDCLCCMSLSFQCVLCYFLSGGVRCF